MKEEQILEVASEQQLVNKVASVDFSFQFSAAREYQKVEKRIFNFLCEISKDFYSEEKNIGILVVLGVFDVAGGFVVNGMRQIGINPVQKYINISSSTLSKEARKIFEEGTDGAIIINRNGQIIGNKVYLIVDNPALEVPDGCGTRHISAASFSSREDVIAVFTLSEETHVVRTWKDSVFVEQYSPEEETEEETEEKK